MRTLVAKIMTKYGKNGKESAENLYTELNDTLDALDETKYDDLKKVKSENNEFYFMNRALYCEILFPFVLAILSHSFMTENVNH